MSSVDLSSELRPADEPRRIGRVPASGLVSRLGLGKSTACYLLAVILVILVVYPVGVLIVSSFFTGQPGRWGALTLNGYRVWLDAEGMLPIVANSVIYASARLVISLSVAVLFAWAVARTNIPYPRRFRFLSLTF